MIDNPSGYDRETILTFPCDTNPFVARTEYRSPIPSFSCWCFGKNPEQKNFTFDTIAKSLSPGVVGCHYMSRLVSRRKGETGNTCILCSPSAGVYKLK